VFLPPHTLLHCRALLLKNLENISFSVSNGESKTKDILKTWKRRLLFLNPALSVGISINF
jgi:hypothetical protein